MPAQDHHRFTSSPSQSDPPGYFLHLEKMPPVTAFFITGKKSLLSLISLNGE